MARHRNSKIKPTSVEIVKLLKRKKSVAKIVAMGYPESTVKYYNRKLFYQESYNRFVKMIGKYNKNAS